jgi:hypothetical protein
MIGTIHIEGVGKKVLRRISGTGREEISRGRELRK